MSDFDALRARYRAAATAEAPRKTRKRREAKRVAAVDGRSLRATGRTAQLNIRCRPELRDSVRAYAQRTRTPLAEVIEAALLAYIALDNATHE